MSERGMKDKLFRFTLILFAFVLTLAAIAGGSYFSAGLDVAPGATSGVLIRAPREVLDSRATDINREEALASAQRLVPIYTIDITEWRFVENNLLLLRGDIEAIRDAYILEEQAFNAATDTWLEEVERISQDFETRHTAWLAVRQEIMMAGGDLSTIPPNPTREPDPPQPQWYGQAIAGFATLHMQFTEAEQIQFMHMEDSIFAPLWAGVMTVAETVQLNHEIAEIDFATERAVLRAIDTLQGVDRATATMVENIVMHHLRPNAIPDIELNDRRFYDAANNYQRIFIQEGQIIVDEGQEITEEIYYLLSELGMLRAESLRDMIIPMVGVLVLVAALFAMGIMYLYFYCPTMLTNKKEALLLFTIFVLSLALMWVLRDAPLPFIAMLIFPMLVSLLIDRRCAIILTIIMVLVGFFIIEGSLAYLLFYITAGTLICLLSRFTTERSKVLFVGTLATAMQFGLFITVSLIIDRSHALDDLQHLFTQAGLAAASGMLTVIICTGSLPFWETFFGVVTPVKLLDLTNPTNLLLRRLTIEAPGTYHHSLIVANLAEAAAYDIGANPHAARVGGYYHDVGKLKSPHYFAENLDGENPHDELEPTNSVQLIINHVSYGLKLAEEHRLPQFVRDMIIEHHGTTILQYFYAKAKETDPEINETDYRYPYVIPQTRESACVMLADSVEAAVRATMPKLNSVDDVEKIIHNIIRGKLNDGQLEDSGLSIRDVAVIQKSFFRVLKGMYHERIAYPKVEPAKEPV